MKENESDMTKEKMNENSNIISRFFRNFENICMFSFISIIIYLMYTNNNNNEQNEINTNSKNRIDKDGYALLDEDGEYFENI